jgi:hypothetical protein
LADEKVPGLADLEAKDPNFSRVCFEDKVEAIFWRVKEARLFGDSARLRRLAHPEIVTQLAAEFAKESIGGEKDFVRHPRLRGAEIVAVHPAKTDEFDRVYVRIVWSFDRVAKMGVRDDLRLEPTVFQQYVLKRRADVKTKAINGLLSLHCAQCGAPEGETDSERCASCGAVMDDGTSDWTLVALIPTDVHGHGRVVVHSHKAA